MCCHTAIPAIQCVGRTFLSTGVRQSSRAHPAENNKTTYIMEEALVRLIKSCLDNTVNADYSTSETDDAIVIGNILSQAELALHPEARAELVNHIGLLRRPY